MYNRYVPGGWPPWVVARALQDPALADIIAPCASIALDVAVDGMSDGADSAAILVPVINPRDLMGALTQKPDIH